VVAVLGAYLWQFRDMAGQISLRIGIG